MDYRLSRSQSRFPPIDEHPKEFHPAPPLSGAQRSKSLDNRRDFVPDDDVGDQYRSIERNSTLHASMPRKYYRDSRGDDSGFFNETLIIPTTQTNNRQGSRISLGHRERDEAGEGDWTSYDRQVRYHTERNAYPVSSPRRPVYYDDYSYRYPPRYADDYGYAQRGARYQQQQQYPIDYPRGGEQHSRTVESQFTRAGPPPGEAQFVRSAAENQEFARGGGENRAAAEYRYAEEEGLSPQVQRAPPPLQIDAGQTTLRHDGDVGGGKHQRYQYHYEAQSGGGAAGGAAGRYAYSNGHTLQKRGVQGYVRPRKERVYHRVECCCFSFKWPPWSYEECEPPREMYPKPPKSLPPPSQY